MALITIPGFSKLSKQAIFDMSAVHLLKQNAKSQIEGERACLYNGPDGRHCAAGIFLKTEALSENFNSFNWAALIEQGYAPDHYSKLIAGLQFIHDECDVDTWRKKLVDLAYREDLNTPVIDSLKA